jgi:beta-mannosidase
METTTPISANWSYTQLTPTRVPDGAKPSTIAQQEKEWHPVHKFPTGVHVELMQRNEIPDHCKGLNEWDIQVSSNHEFAACGFWWNVISDLQWVGESDWRFKTVFEVTKEQSKQDNVDVVFEGLDTFCHVEIVRIPS